MGASTKSGSPVETRGATRQAGGTFTDLFSGAPRTISMFGQEIPFGNEPASIESVLGRLSTGAGRITAGAQQDLLGFGPKDIDLLSAANAVLNPQRFDTTKLFDLLQTQRERTLNTAQRGAAATAGTAGLRFGGNAQRAVRDVGTELGREFSLQDQQLLAGENARVQAQQLQGLIGILDALNKAGVSGQAGVGALLAPILQFIAPGGPIYDPGIGRELLSGVVGGASTLGSLALMPGSSPITKG